MGLGWGNGDKGRYVGSWGREGREWVLIDGWKRRMESGWNGMVREEKRKEEGEGGKVRWRWVVEIDGDAVMPERAGQAS